MTNELFKIDGLTYCESDLPTQAVHILKLLKFTTLSLDNLEDKKAIMLRSKNGYIEDLKLEIVEQKSGVNFSILFEED